MEKMTDIETKDVSKIFDKTFLSFTPFVENMLDGRFGNKSWVAHWMREFCREQSAFDKMEVLNASLSYCEDCSLIDVLSLDKVEDVEAFAKVSLKEKLSKYPNISAEISGMYLIETCLSKLQEIVVEDLCSNEFVMFSSIKAVENEKGKDFVATHLAEIQSQFFGCVYSSFYDVLWDKRSLFFEGERMSEILSIIESGNIPCPREVNAWISFYTGEVPEMEQIYCDECNENKETLSAFPVGETKTSRKAKNGKDVISL